MPILLQGKLDVRDAAAIEAFPMPEWAFIVADGGHCIMAVADIDAYIAKTKPFAVPILETVRAQVFAAVPEAMEEIKWGFPNFTYKGKILCHMAAFKAHATLGFWHGALVTGRTGRAGEAMGLFGKLTSVKDLPDEETLAVMLIKAKQLIDDGVKLPHVEGRGKHAKPDIPMPAALARALEAHAAAKANWDAFPPGCRREYLEWITGAKRDETRDKRIEATIAQLAEGKKLNWKYEKC
jgi:uncharacterized protein YdeI (YjbR/CyaY-like superfamily)